MDIIRLPLGKQAPVDSDCIRVEEQAGGVFTLTGSALCTGDEEGSSVSIVDYPTFASADEAEAAGLVWAQDIGVEQLYLASATLSVPLEETEIDRD